MAWRRALAVLFFLAVCVGYSDTGDTSPLERLERLRAEISYHDDLYYRKAAPEISDAEYDALKKELRLLESMYPDGAPESNRVGDDRTGESREFRHGAPMLSLDKAYSESELTAFYEGARERSGRGEIACLVEPKVDGVAISVLYEKGEFVRAVTRGNGRVGEDVSENALMIAELPRRLLGEAVPERIELRGEVFVSFEGFRRINEERIAAGEAPFSHPRNLAAGSLKLGDADESAARGLSVVFFGYGDYQAQGGEPESQSAFYASAIQWGAPALDEVRAARGLGHLLEAVEAMQAERIAYSFPTDGLVVKVDSRELQRALGASAGAPRWALAYKVSTERVTTRLLGITAQVGRTGLLTPVAELEAVELAGSRIERASLHTFGEIERMDLRIGDWIYLKKAGEIIPQVLGVDFARRDPSAARFEFPHACPSCGRDLSESAGGAKVYCLHEECPERLCRRIEFFVSRDAVSIDGLGEATLRKLVAAGALGDVSDVYRLTVDSLQEAGIGSVVVAERILASIEASKDEPLWRFIRGLGIPGVGEVRSQNVAAAFDDLERFARLDEKDFATGGRMALLGLGPTTEQALRGYFLDQRNREEIVRLVDLGVIARSKEAELALVSSVWGKTFVFSGRLDAFSRDEAKALVEGKGGRVKSSIDERCDYLVVGEKPGKKRDEAKRRGVAILSEREFLGLLGR